MAKVKKAKILKIVKAINEARKVLDKKITSIADPEFNPDEIAEEFIKLQDTVMTLRDYLSLEGNRSSTGDFLEGMATSMIQAQKRLDEHNRTYLSQALADNDIIPAQFRLPRLSAEVHFAIENVTTSGWNILIHSKETESRELNQQILKAELVAAPPPPDLLEKLRARLPGVALVLDPRERDRVREVLELYASERVKKTLLHNDNWMRALILKHAEAGSYALFLTLKKEIDDEKDLGVWHVSTDPPEVTVAYSYDRGPASPTEATANFRAFLNTIIEHQISWYKAQE